MYGLYLNKEELKQFRNTVSDDEWDNIGLSDYALNDGFQGFELVIDGMCGEFLAFGQIIQKTSRWGDEDFLAFNEEDIQNFRLSEDAYSLVRIFNKLFSQKKTDEDISLLIFSLYN